MSAGERERLEIAERAPVLRGEAEGEGLAIVCCHGVTATRDYVLHGSRTLSRRGFRIVTYDARGHGESDPAPEGEGYQHEYLVSDLQRILDAVVEEGGQAVLAGHSMGAHTITALALQGDPRIAGMVVIGPVYTGERMSGGNLGSWQRLADAMEQGGPEAFADAVAEAHTGSARELVHRLALERSRLHRSPAAVAEALRQVTRSRPFGRLIELESVRVPALVVASHDDLDPGHPYAAAEAYAGALPDARLVSEEPGESPLAWQGGQLSRAIASFAEDAGLLGG